MELETKKNDSSLIIKAKGRMDAKTAPDFEKECLEWIDKNETNLIINLGELDYISSAGLRSLLSVGKKLKSEGGKIVFCKLSGMVREVFDISGFASIFPVFDSEEDAVAKG